MFSGGDQPSTASEGRFNMYKSRGMNNDELRKKRRDVEVQIRKQKTVDILENRRKISHIPVQVEALNSIPQEVIDQLKSETLHHEANAIRYLGEKLQSGDLTVPDLSANSIFSILSDIYCNRSKNDILKSAIREILLRSAQIQVRNSCRDTDCVKALCSILSQNEENVSVVCDTLQSVSVFVGVSAAFRNVAFDMAIVPCLLNAYDKQDPRINKCVMWLVSQLFHKLYEYSPCVEEVAPLLEVVASGMRSEDNLVQCDAIRACALMAEWQKIWEEMHANELLPLLVQSLSSGIVIARPSVLRAIDFITQSTSAFTEEMVEHGLLDFLRPLINVRWLSRDVCFILSNITSEGEHMIEKIISSGVLTEVAKVVENAEYSTRKEAAYIICHCCTSSQKKHIAAVVACNVLRAFTDLLTVMDTALVAEILDALDQLLQFGEENMTNDYTNPVAVKLEELGGRDKLDFLTGSQNVEIHVKAYALLERFFDDDELVGLNSCGSELRTNVDQTIDAVMSAVLAKDA